MKNYYDFAKDGAYYKKLSDGTLMVVRYIRYLGVKDNVSAADRDSERNVFVGYENMTIPNEVDGMKVSAIEAFDEGLTGTIGEINNVALPKTLRTLGGYMSFYSNMVFPPSINDVFYKRVHSCTNVVLPSSLQAIGYLMICRGVTIPSSVKKIDSVRFIDSLRMESPIPPVLVECELLESPVYGEYELFVPIGAAEAYKKDPQWGKFKSIHEDPDLGQVEPKKTVVKKQKENKEEKKPNAGIKYIFNDKEYKIRGRLCHDIVKYYAEQNPSATLVTLQKAFNTATNLIVVTPEMAMATTNSDGKAGGNYYMKEEDLIAIRNGKAVVWSYWPERYFIPFMEAVYKLGYSIKEVEQ